MLTRDTAAARRPGAVRARLVVLALLAAAILGAALGALGAWITPAPYVVVRGVTIPLLAGEPLEPIEQTVDYLNGMAFAGTIAQRLHAPGPWAVSGRIRVTASGRSLLFSASHETADGALRLLDAAGDAYLEEAFKRLGPTLQRQREHETHLTTSLAALEREVVELEEQRMRAEFSDSTRLLVQMRLLDARQTLLAGRRELLDLAIQVGVSTRPAAYLGAAHTRPPRNRERLTFWMGTGAATAVLVVLAFLAWRVVREWAL